MNWLVKASMQKSFSYLPKSDEINYFFQHKVAKNLPVSDEKFCEKVILATKLFDTYLEWCPADGNANCAFYEYGAGWDLIGPLTYYALGVENQTLADIHPNVRLDLVNDSLQKFSAYKSKLEHITGKSFKTVSPSPLASFEDLKNRFGISYISPLDARHTGLPAESFDFTSSTNTLEHIPESDILLILAECQRLLKPGGINSAIIDLQDHYSYFDRDISCYNFLKFSDSVWNLINSPLHFQNRLRRCDHLRLFEQAGLEIITEDVDKPTPVELETLKKLRLAPRFQGKYSVEDLGAKTSQIVSRKANGTDSSLNFCHA
jgi:SAM-dependent methyltransferase